MFKHISMYESSYDLLGIYSRLIPPYFAQKPLVFEKGQKLLPLHKMHLPYKF